MKICFVCGEYPPGPHGGVGTMTRVLARALVRSGHEVRVVGVYPPDYAALDFEDDLGVRVWRLRESAIRGGWLLARYELYRTVAEWARRGEVDLVEGPDSRGWFAGWPPLPVPVVQRSNGSYSYFAHELGRAIDQTTFRLERWSYRRASAWAAVSHYTAAITARLFRLRTESGGRPAQSGGRSGRDAAVLQEISKSGRVHGDPDGEEGDLRSHGRVAGREVEVPFGRAARLREGHALRGRAVDAAGDGGAASARAARQRLVSRSRRSGRAPRGTFDGAGRRVSVLHGGVCAGAAGIDGMWLSNDFHEAELRTGAGPPGDRRPSRGSRGAPTRSRTRSCGFCETVRLQNGWGWRDGRGCLAISRCRRSCP